MRLPVEAQAAKQAVRAAFLERLFSKVLTRIAAHPATARGRGPCRLRSLRLVIGQVTTPVVAAVVHQPVPVVTANRAHDRCKFRRLGPAWKDLAGQLSED